MVSPWFIWQKACHLHPEQESSTSSISLETILYPVHLCVFTHNVNRQNLEFSVSSLAKMSLGFAGLKHSK